MLLEYTFERNFENRMESKNVLIISTRVNKKNKKKQYTRIVGYEGD